MADDKTDRGPPARTFKTELGKRLQKDFVKQLNEKSFRDHTDKGHLDAVTKLYNTYRKLHASK